MLSGEMLDLLSQCGRSIRGDDRPFGGIQVILCGDFFQLPPIGVGRNAHFCFESDTWRQLFDQPQSSDGGQGMVLLDTVFRQKDDSVFLNILNEMRKGGVSQRAAQLLQDKVRQCIANDAAQRASGNGSESDVGAVRPTKLFSTNKDVDAFNAAEMLRLASSSERVEAYRAVDEGVEPYLQQLKQGTKAPELLELRVGAQVSVACCFNTALSGCGDTVHCICR